MAQRFRFASAASVLAMASILAGCVSSKEPAVVSSGFGGPVKDSQVGLATRALIALNSNDLENAVSLAERAVERSPDDAGFRTLLGNAYFASGRFASAESAYKDALSIYGKQPQTVLKLALAQIAQGKGAEAVAFLNGSRDLVDPANYGLAVALAGDPRQAVEILGAAARQPGADARIRQNLALAYALTGDWAEARTIAAQDVSADQLDGRIQQWMQFAKPTHHFDQVASLTGVKPAASDPGEPVRLALRNADSRLAAVVTPVAPVQVAQPQVQAQVAQAAPPAAPVLVAAAAPAPAPVPQAETPAPPPPPADPARVATPVAPPPPPAPPAPAVFAAAAAAAPEAPAAFAAFAAPYVAPKPVAAPKRVVRPRPVPLPVRTASLHHGNASSVVQLGSYRSPEWVTAAWTQLQRRYPALRAYLPMRARFTSPQGTFWRLSIQGFESDRDARLRCEALRRSGAACFVRGFAGDAPVEIASR